MQFDHRMDYRGSVADVMAMLVDDGFHADLAATMHALDHQLSVTIDDDGTTHVRVTRAMPAEVPDFIKPLVGTQIDVVQEETWAPVATAKGRSADVAIESPRKPVGFTGHMTLVPTDAGCRQDVTGLINVRLPIGGGKVAEQVHRALTYGMVAQQEVGNRWLAARAAEQA